MSQLEKLIDRIIDRVNVNLREPSFNVRPYVQDLIPLDQYAKFYAFYGLTHHHPLHFHFHDSSLAGSYFLGKCIVDHSVLYKSDIRGDELKNKGDIFQCQGMEIPLHDDEVIRIKNSYLIKNLVHNNSHDPESPEEFFIQNTVSMHYANIHGSPVEGSFLGPFSTVDLTTIHDCTIGTYAYVQTGELAHRRVENGQVWVHAPNAFNFNYLFNPTDLSRYIDMETGKPPQGLLIDFVEDHKPNFEEAFAMVHSKSPIEVPLGAYISRYSVVKGNTRISENVLVAQRAYVEDSFLGKGSNAQENCYIIDSTLRGYNITAHGGKIIHADLGERVFVGFNGFLRGSEECPLSVGGGCIVMPHTIIDLEEPLDIPAEHLVWGHIRNKRDLAVHSLPLDRLMKSQQEIELGAMIFRGSGEMFVKGFQHRIDHILEANGAYYDGLTGYGHAQTAQLITFNIIQPYPEGDLKGLYPTIDICP